MISIKSLKLTGRHDGFSRYEVVAAGPAAELRRSAGANRAPRSKTFAVAAAERKGHLEVRRWEDAYLREGHFDQNGMLALVEEVLTSGKAQGFPLTRLVVNMEWALEYRRGVDDIVE